MEQILHYDNKSASHSPVAENDNALNDLYEGAKKCRLWHALAMHDIKLQYRRTKIGPIWISLSTAILIFGMSVIYSNLFGTQLSTYLPYIASGMLCWKMISSLTNELSRAFVDQKSLITQIKLPFSLHIYRVIDRNLLIFFQQFWIWCIILIIYPHSIHQIRNLLLFIPSLFIVITTAVGVGLMLSMIASRYRDVIQFIQSGLQILFFITPIMWQTQHLPKKLQIISNYNPLYGLIQIIRQPMLGYRPTINEYVISIAFCLISLFIGYIFFYKNKTKIVFWM